jgi:hypothetical protein
VTELTPLARALHSKVWPLVGSRAAECCETIAEENAYMNDAVPRYAPLLLETPPEILGLIWGISLNETIQCLKDIAAALAEPRR